MTAAAVISGLLASTPAFAEADSPEEESALAQAQEAGERVEIPSATDEKTQVFANPDGSFTLETHAAPVRVRTGDGAWTPVDPTLVESADGSLRPRAAAAELAFSGGGADGPMASVGIGSNAVSLDWPSALPEPTMDGPQATYADVLPDVDLILTATTDGFSQVLIVHTAEAGRNPELAELELALATEGVTMREDEGGNLEAVGDVGGRDVFVASAPSMWDSSGSGEASVAEQAVSPAVDARVERVEADVEPSSIRLVPDAAMLTDEATEYPVYIDPSVSVSRQAWAYVNKRWPTTAYYNSGDGDTGVGYEPEYGNTKRAFWQFSVFERTKKDTTVIQRATLRTEVVHAFGCTDAEFRLYRTAGISSKTTWNNQPATSSRVLQDTVEVDKGRQACGGSGTEFDATEAYTWGAEGDRASITLGLYGNETVSGSNLDWRRFAKNPKLVVDYNNKPAQPATAQMSDTLGGVCATDPAAPRLINSTSPTLRAYVRDYDSHWVGQKVKAQFEWQSDGVALGSGDSTYVDVGAWPDGSHRTVTASGLPEGPLIRYRARAHDQAHWGAWSGWCHLRVDTENPETGPDVTSTDYPAGDTAHGSVGRPGAFTFTANGVDDAAAYHYSVNDASCATELVPDEPGGPATALIHPRHDGPNLVHARTTDAHGNSSGCVLVYTFTVAPPSDPVAHFPLDEGQGTTAADTMDAGRSATATGGAEWTRGRIGEASGDTYRLDGTAIATDGSTGRLATEAAVADTSAGFTVSAWARLDAKTGNHTVVSQSGGMHSGFSLGYQSTYGLDNWVLKMPPSDTDDSSGWTRAISDESAQTGVWTHLLGTFDPGTGKATLYVDGVEQATTGTWSTPWNASGALVIGGGRFNGADADAWPGAIDDVRVWDRIVIGEKPAGSNDMPETWHLANRPAALGGHWRLDETAGTEAADASDRGLTGTLHGDPATAWSQAENDVTFSPGVTLDGAGERITTSAPALRTDRSFSVAAWVRLDESGTNSTALSQDGNAHSGFYLGHQATYDWDQWVFKTAPADRTGASGWSRALSVDAPELGAWVHLAATYDHTTREMTLFVDGVEQGTATQATPWHADGATVIGAARFEEGLSDAWGGDIDDVHVYQGVLSQNDIYDVYEGFLPSGLP
jgi:hypothetical protein